MKELKFRALFEIVDKPNEPLYDIEPTPNVGKKEWRYIGLNHFLADKGDKQLSPWLQDTGLADKNGKEIWEGDMLLIEHKIGEEPNLFYSKCYYRVNGINFEGLSLTATKMFDENPSNQYPLYVSLSFKSGSLCLDYRNSNYDRICLEDTFNENTHQRIRWQSNHYSNDIEVVGDIFNNPELLK